MAEPLLSIAIPTYEMKPHGVDFLNHSLFNIYIQSFKDFNVVISDQSKDSNIEELIESWRMKLNIKYIRKVYDTDNAPSNINNALKHCDGKFIKILFQDDFLFDSVSLEHTVQAIINNPDCKWLASACIHSYDGFAFFRPFAPRWNDQLLNGVNTISSPSVVTLRNEGALSFDTDLTWLMDCEYYYRCYSQFGAPVIIDKITVVNRIWSNQLTNVLSDEMKKKDFDIIKRKYAHTK